ncbi:FabD/lysophospholipase-like protein [Daldinia eschscholtzii]|nr:FabD/lysophospholipase-like protein [Daldinia eschscholtzii]
MLGRLRMTVDDCIDEYKHLAGDVFGHPRYLHYMNSFIPRCKYSTENFEAVIKEVIVRRVEDGVKHNPQNVRFETEPGLCRVFVIASKTESDGTVDEHRFFRSYDINTRRRPRSELASFAAKSQAKHSGSPGDVCVWHVARATTAAPMYFKPLELTTGGNERRATTDSSNHRASALRSNNAAKQSSQVEQLEDGGFGAANNPSKEVFDEVKRHLPSNMEVGTFVSIGTARPMERPTGPKLYHVIRRGIARLSNPEPTHYHMEREVGKEDNPCLSYFRFNEPGGLEKIRMDDWKPRATGQDTIREMEIVFNSSAAKPEMVRRMQKCAKELVAARRARTVANIAKWKRFALGTYFYCGEDNCPDEVQREIEEVKFRAHLEKEHGIIGAEVEAALRRSEGQWVYRRGC